MAGVNAWGWGARTLLLLLIAVMSFSIRLGVVPVPTRKDALLLLLPACSSALTGQHNILNSIETKQAHSLSRLHHV